MKIIFLILVFPAFLCGCLSVPFILGSSGITNLVEEGVVECHINVGIEKLWSASLEEFRKIKIIEADKKKLYIKAKDKDAIIEFKAASQDDIHSVFRIRASSINGLPQSELAQAFANRIYKKARSLWFSLTQFFQKS